jgi:AcrR family transcriptional regulator
MSDMRDRILARACDLYLEEGLQGFSMRKLARSVGVTAPALYRHYENKERVLVAVVGEAYKLFGQFLYRSLAGHTPLERLHLAATNYLEFALGHPRQYEMLYVSPAALGLDRLPQEVEEHACATGQFWHDRVRECMDAGLLREGSPEEVSMTMWAHAHGLLFLYLRGLLEMDEAGFRRMFEASSIRLFEGLAAPRLFKELAERGEVLASAG